MSTSDVILYRYDFSLFSHKIDNLLAMKGIKHSIVNVDRMPPRPELAQLLGVAYRQIPVLAIGNDVYCDSGLIASALEKRFPGTKSMYSPRKDGSTSDVGLIKAFSKYYGDALFMLAVGLLPWDMMPKEIEEDRAQLFGMNTAAAKASHPHTRGQLISQLALLDEQLSDGREWLFDTKELTLADISVHFILAWMRSFGESAQLDKEKLPNLSRWFSQAESQVQSWKAELGAPIKLQGEDAAKHIASAKWEDYSVVGFEAGGLGVSAGDMVSVLSTSIRESNPTVGKLVCLDMEEIVIEAKGESGTVRCHFPRNGFAVRGNNGNA